MGSTLDGDRGSSTEDQRCRCVGDEGRSGVWRVAGPRGGGGVCGCGPAAVCARAAPALPYSTPEASDWGTARDACTPTTPKALWPSDAVWDPPPPGGAGAGARDSTLPQISYHSPAHNAAPVLRADGGGGGTVLRMGP